MLVNKYKVEKYCSLANGGGLMHTVIVEVP